MVGPEQGVTIGQQVAKGRVMTPGNGAFGRVGLQDVMMEMEESHCLEVCTRNPMLSAPLCLIRGLWHPLSLNLRAKVRRVEQQAILPPGLPMAVWCQPGLPVNVCGHRMETIWLLFRNVHHFCYLLYKLLVRQPVYVVVRMKVKEMGTVE